MSDQNYNPGNFDAAGQDGHVRWLSEKRLGKAVPNWTIGPWSPPPPLASQVPFVVSVSEPINPAPQLPQSPSGPSCDGSLNEVLSDSLKAVLFYVLVLLVVMVLVYCLGSGKAEDAQKREIDQRMVATQPVGQNANLEVWPSSSAAQFSQPTIGRPWTIPGVNLAMVAIPAGDFEMGSPPAEPNRQQNETQHRVSLTQAYWLGQYVVTKGQFRSFVDGTNYQTETEKTGGIADMVGGKMLRRPGTNWKNAIGGADNYPVIGLTWNDAKAFCAWLSQRERISGRLPKNYRYTLPTEAQWEYAARAGSPAASATALENVAWFAENSESHLHPVGQKHANVWGLYDMNGNVWQWCEDWYEGDYKRKAATDPIGASLGSLRVLRGGGWGVTVANSRFAFRSYLTPDSRFNFVGFRLALSPTAEAER